MRMCVFVHVCVCVRACVYVRVCVSLRMCAHGVRMYNNARIPGVTFVLIIIHQLNFHLLHCTVQFR